ncbi:cysteine--tRNA ligase [Chelativorans sp. M5D2P16]|uniref:cysteine--tRNA ligase n=1 Tax=Chelativorans sp. M5D2P16 TaxID=3095678 RepID=UPI002ACAE7EB|nr:cysteine--tRNA ligase [Chelativorans sp. M5D2P16]MDZ5696260.1 cysteine--tRNA ligase [Chelativorans sp. M5D2P16]
MSEGFEGLRIYNTLTRRKEDFVPLDADHVRMYVCGPTVYDFAHIGNARPVIVFDVLFRLLRHLYGVDHVTYVRNITDVDDKINARALRDYGAEVEAGRLSLNDAIRHVTEKTGRQFHADVAALGCLPPTVEPRATEFVLPRADGKTDMVSLIQRLIDRGHAYEAKGEILFDTASMPDYGGLSRRRLEDQQAGARVAVEAHKKNPADFVLWKQSSVEEPGWEATFTVDGKPLTIRGRPGWHIECSAMSAAYLGEVFDIHGGGIDLVFPHHENEIAQSRCAHGTPTMAGYWMHNGFVQVEGRKMAKSEGNFVTIHDLLETENFGGRRWPGEVLRLAMLMTHYRDPLDFSQRKLEEAEAVLDGWYRAVGEAEAAGVTCSDTLSALLDDLNTTGAIMALHDLRAEASKGGAGAKAAFKASARLLGLLDKTEDEWFSAKAASAAVDEAAVEARIASRLAFIREKNFAEADRIRAELSAQRVQLMDYKDSETGERRTRWEVKR